MEKQPYLIFSLSGELFAIAASVVREMFWLPELTPMEEAPPSIAGVLNLRKKIVPVTDLNMLFGHACIRYNLTDSIIALEAEDRIIGIIVNEVRDVIDISSEDIEPSPFYLNSALSPQTSALETSRHHFIDSEARVGEDIIMILNHNKVFDAGFHAPETEEHKLKESHYFCTEATPEERKVFHERAVNLMHVVEEEGLAGLMPMAVVGLGGEYFAMDLELIREFSDIPDLTPIPCCPEHILGNMNLRGNVLTVIDIRDSLNLPVSAGKPAKVIVAGTGELSAGIAVDNVFDVIYVNPSNITPVPSAVRTNTEQYIKGTAPYNNKVMTILDLKKILDREELVVNEEA